MNRGSAPPYHESDDPMLGNTIFITLDEMAEGLPDLFEYIGSVDGQQQFPATRVSLLLIRPFDNDSMMRHPPQGE